MKAIVTILNMGAFRPTVLLGVGPFVYIVERLIRQLAFIPRRDLMTAQAEIMS